MGQDSDRVSVGCRRTPQSLMGESIFRVVVRFDRKFGRNSGLIVLTWSFVGTDPLPVIQQALP